VSRPLPRSECTRQVQPVVPLQNVPLQNAGGTLFIKK
jgi:hypothetical protein